MQDLPKVSLEDMTLFSQVCQNLGISREICSKRMDFLQIKPWKIKGRLYLDPVQVNHMNSLHEHYQQKGNFDGYPVPALSEPWAEELNNNQSEATETSPEGVIVKAEDLATASPQQLSTTNSLSFTPAVVRSQPQPSTDTAALNNLVASAQSKAAGVLIAENVLAQQYIQNPDLLPDELKVKIEESAQIPKIDPFAYASSLINLVRAGERLSS
ncbi:MAG TPA: hypothetical protein DDZ80_25575 [Cyanobacteria bacterium UBA8803]|nr:hypothetical protein [Cyanobacteria bacterium UBA9273]HBL61665.1 hypothetical protein [Cyanobacteria bacterium UBA8803]